MKKKRKYLLGVVFIGLTFSIVKFTCQSIWVIEPFFVLSLSDPTAPINELFNMHHALRSTYGMTPFAVDAKGHFYIAGGKNSKARILVLNSKGKIKRIITPCLKDGHPLEYCPLISVSPSGNHIWTLTPISPLTYQVTVHDQNGKAKAGWTIHGGSISHWLINAYSENNAYGVCERFFLRFTIGQRQPEKLLNYVPLPFPFFHNGKLWWAGRLDVVMERPFWTKLKNQCKGINPQKFWGVVTWAPGEGYRLIQKVLIDDKVLIGRIDGIDQQGNFYCISDLSLKTPIGIFLSLLFRFQPVAKVAQTFGVSKPLEQRIKTLKVVSTQGRILDTIPLPWLIKSREGEELRYDELVKVDETGIYLEVERVSEPREYRIVRIVKKPRWKVWWKRLK